MPGKESTESNLLREAFRARAEGGLARILAHASDDALARALAAPTDIGMITRILCEADIANAAAREMEPGTDKAAAFAAKASSLLAKAGGLMGSEEVSGRLRISRQAVEKRRRNNNLLAISQGSDWRYPRCQFTGTEVVGGIPNLVRRLAARGQWGTLETLVTAVPELGGRSPMEVLSDGGAGRARMTSHLDALTASDWGMDALRQRLPAGTSDLPV